LFLGAVFPGHERRFAGFIPVPTAAVNFLRRRQLSGSSYMVICRPIIHGAAPEKGGAVAVAAVFATLDLPLAPANGSHMKLLTPFILFALLLAPAAAPAMTGEKAELQKLADGIYAFVGKRNDANALVIVTAQGVVLADTGNNPPETRILRQDIESITKEPVRYVVITQNHGDHSGGTPLFSPPATVIVQDRVAKDWAAMKPYQIKSWQKRFAERADALKGINPLDTVVSFSDRLTLHVGGKTIELIYIDDTYNPGDVAVWLPAERVLHAGFAGYIGRHPDIRPDYSHGTTTGMIKQLEALSALKPAIVVPAHGPVGDATALSTLTDYLLLARQKVRTMMQQGLPLDEIEKKFDMHEFADWDRGAHLSATAATIYRELKGEGPEITPYQERTAVVTVNKLAEEGRFLSVTAADGRQLQLRAAGDVDFEGIKDRSELKVGMKLKVTYLEPTKGEAPLGFDITELDLASTK
jgi:cyclase